VITNGSMVSRSASSRSAACAASNGGVAQLTRALAIARAPDAISANRALPGWVDTPLTRGARCRREFERV
jgi:2-deoxy-D-gluconate 3-dehydrogenase